MNKLKILAFILLIIVAEKTYSQDSTLTLFKLPHISSVGIYAAPEFQYGQLDKTFTNFGGGAIMIILNNHFAFGGSWIQNMTIRYSPNDLNKLFLKSSFGGLKFEYTINPNSIVHFSFPVLIGMGMSRLDSSFHNNKFKSDSIHKNFSNSLNMGSYQLIQAGVQIETNVLSFLKIFAGCNYRYAFLNSKPTNLPKSILNGFSLDAGLKMGLFDFSTKRKKQSK